MKDKLLQKAPFRFVHDVISNVTAATGFGARLFDDRPELLDGKNIKDKQAKLDYLDRCLACIGHHVGEPLEAKSGKIVAGMEPELTNKMFQMLAKAAKAGNDPVAVQAAVEGREVLASGAKGGDGAKDVRLDLRFDDDAAQSQLGSFRAFNHSKMIIHKLIHLQKNQRLGVAFDAADEAVARVTAVRDNTPASEGGLLVEDVIIGVGNLCAENCVTAIHCRKDLAVILEKFNQELVERKKNDGLMLLYVLRLNVVAIALKHKSGSAVDLGITINKTKTIYPVIQVKFTRQAHLQNHNVLSYFHISSLTHATIKL